MKKNPISSRNLPFKWESKSQVEKWISDHFNESTQQQQFFSHSASPGSSFTSIDVLKSTVETKTIQSEQKMLDQMKAEFLKLFREQNIDHKTSNFIYFSIPGTNWIIARPHEFERISLGKLRLPAVPSKDMIFFLNYPITNIQWQIPDEIAGNNGVKLLMEEHQLIAHQKDLLRLIYLIAMKYPNPVDCSVQTLLWDPTFFGAELEEQMMKEFDDRIKMERNKAKVFCTNYLLIDPRAFHGKKHAKVAFHEFVESIFYMGRTRNDMDMERPFNHLKNVFGKTEEQIQQVNGTSFKRSRIREIWNAGYGVIVLLVFKYTDENAAKFREACMIRARMGRNNFLYKCIETDDDKRQNMMISESWQNTILGPNDLTNKRDEMVGEKMLLAQLFGWDDSAIAIFGSRLLLRAYAIFGLERNVEVFERDFSTHNLPGPNSSTPEHNVSASSRSSGSPMEEYFFEDE